MRYFFHADISVFEAKQRKALSYILLPTFLGAVFTTLAVLILMSLVEIDYLLLPLAVALSIFSIISVILSLLITSYYARKIKNHSRYTFIDIYFSGIIISLYKNTYHQYRRKVIERDIYLIKHNDITSIKGDYKALIKGKIKRYNGDSERLSYHFEKGEAVFDTWWLNDNGFTYVDELQLPEILGSGKELKKSIAAAQRYRTLTLAKKKQKAFEPVIIKRRKRRQSYYANEIRTFDRKW